jgi:hypothetical protein
MLDLLVRVIRENEPSRVYLNPADIADVEQELVANAGTVYAPAEALADAARMIGGIAMGDTTLVVLGVPVAMREAVGIGSIQWDEA